MPSCDVIERFNVSFTYICVIVTNATMTDTGTEAASVRAGRHGAACNRMAGAPTATVPAADDGVRAARPAPGVVRLVAGHGVCWPLAAPLRSSIR